MYDDIGGEMKILSDCTAKNAACIFRYAEKRMARTAELAHIVCRKILSGSDADIMDVICTSDEAREEYISGKKALECDALTGLANKNEAANLKRTLSLCDVLYFCREISRFGGKTYAAADAERWLSDGDIIQYPRAGDVKIAFVRGRQANDAFAEFARYIHGGAMPYGEESFADVCQSVYSGIAEYGIIPVENSSDGRLASFYGMFEKFGLYIIMLCEVMSGDGESYTKFALCSRSVKALMADGEKTLHFRLTLDSPDGITALLYGGRYYGASLRRAEPIPVSAAGRENSFDISFCVDGADLAGFICCLKLEYPQFSTVGLYTSVKAGDGV